MRKLLLILAAVAVCAVVSGCATSRSSLDINVPVTVDNAQFAEKEVYINSITDKRVFEASPRSPNIPSLDPSEASSPEIKLRAVGRKRNTYGKALGDILLKEGETVETLLAASVRKAFAESGYKILNDRSQATANTYIVDGAIDQFWTWFTPGFWQITIATEIGTTLTITPPESGEIKKVSANSQLHAQTGLESNYIESIQNALQAYIGELKRQLQ